MSKLRWGILSTARIGVEKVIPAMQQGEHCEVTAIASRELGRAQDTARRLGIPRAFGSYEELLAEQSVATTQGSPASVHSKGFAGNPKTSWE